ncbi:hypothetical protein PG999_011148 [Apiospora kogelbergensis]|uniref:Uncharacterized protein n=1 Tax=Apiospora kogelbergensis TaxID=1337665 RepID=A0AAW0QNE3_9PEZI
MDPKQESEATRSEAEVAAAAVLGFFAHSSDDGPSKDADDNKEDSPLNANQATDAGNHNGIPTAPAGDNASQEQPQQVDEMAPPAKRGRGRPRKHPLLADVAAGSTKVATPAMKLDDVPSIETPPSKRRRGRPPKRKGDPSPSAGITPARVRSDLETEQEFGTPSTNREEWLDKREQASSFSPINVGQRPSATKTSDYQSANIDAFGLDLKSKIREALFNGGLEYNGGVHIPQELAQGLHDYLGAGLPAPRGDLFIHAELVEELRHLLR